MSDIDFTRGFASGMAEAARILRDAAEDHRDQARACKKVLEAQAHELAAALLDSWANGFTMKADALPQEPSEPFDLRKSPQYHPGDLA